MSDTSLSKLVIGTAELPLLKWTKRVTPIVSRDAMTLRIGSEVVIAGEGEVHASTHTLLAAAIAAAETAMRVFDTAVKVIEFGTIETASLLPADCVDGGPHIQFQWLEQTAGLSRRFMFEARGRTTNAGGGGGGATSEASAQTMTRMTSLGLRQEQRTGSIVGPGAGTQYSSILNAWLSAHPWPNWTVSSERRYAVAAETAIEYVLAAAETADDLPGGVGVEAVEGTRTETVDTDYATGRTLITISYDLLVDGDMEELASLLEPAALAPDERIIRETISYGTIRERRLQATWQILRGETAWMLDWSQSWQIIGAEWGDEITGPIGHQALRTVSYPGAAPLIIRDAKPEFRYAQSGRAVGVGAYIKPAPPLFPEALARPIEVEFKRLSNVEYETVWRYEFASETQLATDAGALERPGTAAIWTAGSPV